MTIKRSYSSIFTATLAGKCDTEYVFAFNSDFVTLGLTRVPVVDLDGTEVDGFVAQLGNQTPLLARQLQPDVKIPDPRPEVLGRAP